MSAAEWTEGVGGVQCQECGRTTICKAFGVGQEEGGDHEWLCRPCYVQDDPEPADCGHVCCDYRTGPLHDHPQTPVACPFCADCDEPLTGGSEPNPTNATGSNAHSRDDGEGDDR